MKTILRKHWEEIIFVSVLILFFVLFFGAMEIECRNSVALCSFNLLTVGNPKTVKGIKKGFLTFILHLAPSVLSGYQVCAMASEACRNLCLNFAGRAGILKKGATTNPIQEARIRRTKLFFENRPLFFSKLSEDITRGLRMAKRKALVPVFRLNGTSDLRWERIRGPNGGTILESFPRVQFYDYTKIPGRGPLPSNYHLTFSLSESNGPEARQAFESGLNVAIVFRKTLPEFFRIGSVWVPVYDGDLTDLRFLDPSESVIGLRAKGRAKLDRSGFVYDPSESVIRMAPFLKIASQI